MLFVLVRTTGRKAENLAKFFADFPFGNCLVGHGPFPIHMSSLFMNRTRDIYGILKLHLVLEVQMMCR